MKKYVVTLTTEERHALSALITAGKGAAAKLAHGRILRKADAGPGVPASADERIADAVEVSRATVERVGQRFVEQGLEAALVREKPDRPNRQPALDGAAEARLIALSGSRPPAWTLRLLADKLVELEVVGYVCHETVRQVPKKRA